MSTLAWDRIHGRSAVKLAVGLLVVAVCGALGVWGSDFLLTQGEAEESQRQQTSTRVTVASPAPREVTDSVASVGTIHPARSVELRPLAPGRVETVHVSSGEQVEAGAPILQLDARAARADVARAEATYAAARQDFARVRELSDENVAAEARLEEASAAAEQAEAELEAARAALEDRRLQAPFAGTLGIVTTDPGEYVDSTTSVAALDDLSAVEAAFALPEKYYARVTPGQTVRLTTAVYPDRSFTGTVTVRAAAIDPASRSFDVRARLENPERRLAGGMFVEAELVFGSATALTVPDDAIISEGASTYVYTVEEGSARRTEIAVGESVGARTEVTEGLTETARVVLTGWDNLSDGAAVTVAQDTSEEALN